MEAGSEASEMGKNNVRVMTSRNVSESKLSNLSFQSRLFRIWRELKYICLRDRKWFHFHIATWSEIHTPRQITCYVQKSCHFTQLQKEGTIQGTSKRLFPGCENMWWKNCVCLPEVGKQNATFSPDFTQPGKSLLEVPCT